ncbi:hypothetical protein [Nevskia ramosa]
MIHICSRPGCDQPCEPGKFWCCRACWWAEDGRMNERCSVVLL